jgi:D-ribose pyranase
MKKVGIINQPIAAVISGLGHTDTITIADAGLPIASSTQRIDLALMTGVPSFVQTLQAILEELFVEKAIVAEEMKEVSPHIFEAVSQMLPGVSIELVPHVLFKEHTARSKAVIRSGEFTPYANIILVAGAWGFNLD